MTQDKFTVLLEGFSKLDFHERLERLEALGVLTAEETALLNSHKVPSINLAEKFIENVIGYFPIPMGVAVNFKIDQKDYIIPMAVEETSIVAAASKTAKWIRQQGEITTQNLGHLSIGQIQIAKVKNLETLTSVFHAEKDNFITELNQSIAKGLMQRGGGVESMTLRTLPRPDGETMAVIHIHVNTCDAMGANIIVQICEYLKSPLETLTGETITMAILSNLNDQKLTRAKVVIRDIDPVIGQGLVEASLFAELDPYRATTSNKGALNGMDPILIATGNDWRAVEAGIHAYAARDGQYRSITQWRMEGNDLIGVLEAPICVGTVGGMTRLHPSAQINLKILNVSSSDELARVIAAAGLVQNLGAIKALTTIGLIEGHMKLHIDNLTLSAGANEDEIPELKERLKKILLESKNISLSHAITELEKLRNRSASSLSEVVYQ